MASFKLINLLLALLVLGACVPQTKQTECGANDAFNATLRTCVPIMNGPSSFINIKSFLPTSTLTKYKRDTTPVTFTVIVSNPYAQDFTFVWEKIYNGTTATITPVTSGTSSSYSIAPSSLSTELGIHIFSVKVLDSSLKIVDSHNFQLIVNDNPKPIILSSSVTPPTYYSLFTPLDLTQNFSFTISNNSADVSGLGYTTEWKLYRSGVLISAQSNPFSDTSSSGSNYPSFAFDPNLLGVGTYTLNARITNIALEVIAEQQWSMVVSHPPLSPITSRNIYSGSSTPVFTTTTIAYNGVAYTSDPLYNFIPTGQASQGDYCVTVADGEGTYVGDFQFVKVDFYLDGASLIYSGTTSAINNKVCLSDAGAGTLNSVLFSNSSSTVTQNHTLVARVIDERTGQEYSLANMNSSLGNYPISWNFSVRPTNAAPTVTFTASGNLSNITCGAISANSRTCTVTQDQAFTIGIHATDDFYSTSSTNDSVQNKFTYTMTLLRNGSTVSTCTKTTADVTDGNAPGTDYVGPDYLCSFTVASFDATGSINPALDTYSVSIVFSDVGSPITGSTGVSGATITYNLNVTETNTAPSIVPQQNTAGSSTTDSYLSKSTAPTTVLNPGTATEFITEGETLLINIRVNDAEMDDHQVLVYLCTDFTSNCATTSLLSTQTVLKTDNVNPTLTTINYSIPENLLPISTPLNTNVLTYFKIQVTDLPDTVSGLTAATTVATSPIHFRVNVRNKNPAPQFGGTPSPLVNASLTAMVGYPLTIDPGTVTDASVPSSEKTISYQWYIDPDGGDNSFAAIPGATSRILKWTPSNAIASGTLINLALCISDGTAVNPLPSAAAVGTTPYNPANGANCLQSWDVTVRPNAVVLNYNNGTLSVGPDLAILQDTTGTSSDKKVIYSAYSDTNGVIFIEKTVFDANGNIYNNDTTGFRTINFNAVPDGTQAPSTIKDISLAATPTHLYIAYQAATTSTPSSPKIRIRRIDKRYGTVYGSKTDSSYPHPGKFGFYYDTVSLLPATDAAPNIDINQIVLGDSITVNFAGPLSSGNILSTNFVDMTASDTPTLPEHLCSGAGGCTQAGNATRYESFINNSSDRALQGVTAYRTGTTTTLYGSQSGAEYLDSHATLLSYTTGKLGKIMILGNDWYLPFVDLTTASTLNNIRVLSADARDTSVLDSSLTVSDTTVYTSIGAVNWFTNDVDTLGNIIIGAVNTSNIAQLYSYTTGNLLNQSVNLFSSTPIDPTTLRIAAPVTNNDNYYVIAKGLITLPSTYEWIAGRYNSSFVIESLNNVSVIVQNAATSSVMGVNNIKDVSIEAYPSLTTSTEARLMVASGTNLYVIRMKDNYLSCDLCLPINISTDVLSPSKRIATTKIDLDMTIGTAGSTATSTENTKDVLFSIYPVSRSGGIYRPHMGIFNMEVESIQSTTSDTTGTLGHRPPFVGEN